MTFSTRAAVAGTGMLLLATLRAPAQAPLSKEIADPAATHTTWRDYGGGAGRAQYSALTQINRTNVSKLQVAWTYPTGDSGNYLFNPVVVDDVMYVLAKSNSIVALDAATGKELWTHETGHGPHHEPRHQLLGERGPLGPPAACSRSSQFLQALDARTGDADSDVRRRTAASTCATASTAIRRSIDVQSGTPGRVFENLIILGSATNQEYDSAPGDIRAFDVRTGKLVWTFHTVPRPGEFGYDTWPPDAWKTVGGANAWGELSIDEAARHRLRPDRQSQVQLLRRQPQGRQPLRRLPARARRAHGQAPLALPDGPPRHLGLRQRDRAEAAHRPPQRADRSTSSRRRARPGFSTSSTA